MRLDFGVSSRLQRRLALQAEWRGAHLLLNQRHAKNIEYSSTAEMPTAKGGNPRSALWPRERSGKLKPAKPTAERKFLPGTFQF
jgi:hypothetical protein